MLYAVFALKIHERSQIFTTSLLHNIAIGNAKRIDEPKEHVLAGVFNCDELIMTVMT